MKLKTKRLFSLVLCIAALMMLACSGITAAASNDKSEAYGVLTLICKTDEAVLSDMKMRVFRVGSRQDDGSFALEGDFAEYPVALDDMSVSAVQKAAATLVNYAVVDKLAPAAERSTDSKGEAVFEGLTPGLYLITGSSAEAGGKLYTPSAALIELTENGGETFDLTVYPKFTVTEIPSPDITEFKVIKLWENDNIDVRPEAISVELYCDGVLKETVELNEANGWSYKWSASADSEWKIKEKDIPKDYQVSYKSNETQFTIVNSYSTSVTTDSSETDIGSETETSSNGGKLPQTGQLWWPVPALSAAGLILIAVGVRVNSKRK